MVDLDGVVIVEQRIHLGLLGEACIICCSIQHFADIPASPQEARLPEGVGEAVDRRRLRIRINEIGIRIVAHEDRWLLLVRDRTGDVGKFVPCLEDPGRIRFSTLHGAENVPGLKDPLDEVRALRVGHVRIVESEVYHVGTDELCLLDIVAVGEEGQQHIQVQFVDEGIIWRVHVD